MFGVPGPEHFAIIGYVHNYNLPLGNIALQLQEGLMVFSYDLLHSLKIKKHLLNSPKLSFGIKTQNISV